MKMTRSKAMAIWEKAYGDLYFAEDFAGGTMFKGAYGDNECYLMFNGKRYYLGWNIHHILPKSLGGASDENNLICTNIETNKAAGNKTSYWIAERHYQICKVKGESRYEIKTIK